VIGGSSVGRATPHESARDHVSGLAAYSGDLLAGPAAAGCLLAWPVHAPHARARLVRLDAAPASTVPGVVAVLTAADVRGENDSGPVRHDEPLLPVDEVQYHGQAVAWVLGETEATARAGAALVQVTYEPLPALLSIEAALAAGSFHTEPLTIKRGDPAAVLARCERVLEGTFRTGAQDHFALETHVALALLDESGQLLVHASTQHPSETQAVVARVLGVSRNRVVVQCLRMGGAFGGKETQANPWAAVAALGCWKTGRPVLVRLNRDQHMILTGKRHPMLARYAAGVTAGGDLQALRVELFSDGGWSLDLSEAVLSRALFHLDNAYFVPHFEVTGRVVKTNTTSHTAFRGFGGPQGMLVVEEIVDRASRAAGLPAEAVRRRNLYGVSGERAITPYGQTVAHNRLPAMWDSLLASSDFAARRTALRRWNETSRSRKRGLAITPVKFGIAFTTTFLNQAGALILIYADGSVQVNHGGTEMGQGLHTKMQQVAADSLGVPPAWVRLMPTRTDKVPNTSATAASSGADLNGGAVRDAAGTLRERLAPVAAGLLAARAGQPVPPGDVRFAAGRAWAPPGGPESGVDFREVVQAAYLARVSLSATGYYRTPQVHFDRATGRGNPFHYFAFSVAVSEVEVDGLTGESTLRRVDVLHDVGESLNPHIDRGQIEGGFVQGAGWLTCEEVLWDAAGRLLTHAPSTYKIPTIADVPVDFRVTLLPRAPQPGVVYGSKAVGEPPLMAAISVREAIRDAVAAFGAPAGATGGVVLDTPATPEAILRAVESLQAAHQAPRTERGEQRLVVAAGDLGGGQLAQQRPEGHPAVGHRQVQAGARGDGAGQGKAVRRHRPDADPRLDDTGPVQGRQVAGDGPQQGGAARKGRVRSRVRADGAVGGAGLQDGAAAGVRTEVHSGNVHDA
jgi:xanthine dehydrogenase large subunit